MKHVVKIRDTIQDILRRDILDYDKTRQANSDIELLSELIDKAIVAEQEERVRQDINFNKVSLQNIYDIAKGALESVVALESLKGGES